MDRKVVNTAIVRGSFQVGVLRIFDILWYQIFRPLTSGYRW